jgi:hypothetical protein
MKAARWMFLVIALLAFPPGISLGDEARLQVSVKGGLVSISSTQSTLATILARLSRELELKINAPGVQENRVVSCEIEGVGMAEALQKLVPEWNSLTFSREERSIEIGITDREESHPEPGKTGMPVDGERNASDPSSPAEESDLPGDVAAPSTQDEPGDSTTVETGEEENRDEVADGASPSEKLNGDDEGANEPSPSEEKNRSRRHGPLRLW